MQFQFLEELVFKPGQKKGQENCAVFPLLTIKGITHAISIGPGSKNMAESFNFDSSDLTKRQSDFLAQNNFAPFSASFISFVPRPGEPKIVDIEMRNETGHPQQIPAEGMFTRLADVPLIHKPADCPTAILYGHDESGQPVLGLIHLGRPQVNERVTEQALEHLEENYGVDLTSLVVGITPSIGPKHYFIRKSDQDERHIIEKLYWGAFIQEDTLESISILRIDVLGKILSTMAEYGIPENHIQAYGHTDAVDTFALASKNPPEAFSHRFAVSTNQPERNGRIMIVCEL